MTICIDVAFDTVDLWIVVGDGASRIHAQYFTFICGPILGSNLFRSWEVLRLVIQTEQSELVFALITYSIACHQGQMSCGQSYDRCCPRVR